ncbi:hypothetical protein ACS0TY_019089 [Phlomoides rotata]
MNPNPFQIKLIGSDRPPSDTESIPNHTESTTTAFPRIRLFGARVHTNPLSDSHFSVLLSPSQFDFTDRSFSPNLEFAGVSINASPHPSIPQESPFIECLRSGQRSWVEDMCAHPSLAYVGSSQL